jgi:uncharacterized membrane protein HdeD (DUF308 family)
METGIGVLPRHAWAFALRGLAAIAFGILAFAWPGLTLRILVLLFGAYALVDGVMAIVSAIRGKGGGNVWGLLLEGVLGILAGIVVISWPDISALVLVYFIAAWAVVTGILEIFSAVRLRQLIQDEWAWGISGVLSVIFGLLLISMPQVGALALVWLIGIYAILFGVTLLILAWRLHRLTQGEHHGGASLQQPVAP